MLSVPPAFTAIAEGQIDCRLDIRNDSPYPKANPIRDLNSRGGRPRHLTKAIPRAAMRASAQSSAVRELNRALIQSQQQCEIAQSLIERLVKRNTGLEQELLQLAHREAQTRRLAYHDALTG